MGVLNHSGLWDSKLNVNPEVNPQIGFIDSSFDNFLDWTFLYDWQPLSEIFSDKRDDTAERSVFFASEYFDVNTLLILIRRNRGGNYVMIFSRAALGTIDIPSQVITSNWVNT